MGVDAREMEKMIVATLDGVSVVDGESKERAEVRLELAKQVAEIEARGGMVDVPGEIPDISDDDPLAR